MTANDYVAAVLPKLTINAAITLKNPDRVGTMLGHVFTGCGKWTTIAAIGVFNNLRAAGCAEERPREFGGGCWHLTPLGLEVADRLREHWDECSPLLRDPLWHRGRRGAP